jgi:hypothetical protein
MRSTSIRGLAAAAALAGVLWLAPPAGAAPPLQSLRTWAGVTATRLAHAQAPGRDAENAIAHLRRLVGPAAARLRLASPGTRQVELARTATALASALDPTVVRLSGAPRYFFLLAYQAELERLAERAGLDRAPTGRPLATRAAIRDTRRLASALVPDTNGDGLSDLLDADDDGDGRLDAVDGSDLGWGIPDGFAARRDLNRVSGRPAALGGLPGAPAPALMAAVRADRAQRGYCIWSTEAVPRPRTVAAARRWRARAQRRGCEAPVAVAGTVAPEHGSALARLGVRIDQPTMRGRELALQVRAARDTRLVFEIVSWRTVQEAPDFTVERERVVLRRVVSVERGRSRLRVRFASAPDPGTATLRVTARRGARQARQTYRVPVLAVEMPPPTSPAAPAAPPAPRPVPPLPAPRRGCDQDSDGDTVPDCDELAGFDWLHYLPGGTCPTAGGVYPCRQTKVRHVTSDPDRPNTDNDALVVDGRTFALDDGEEWALASVGGVSDPSAVDSDRDGIGDVEEVDRWGSAPDTPDSDDDSVVPNSALPPNPLLFDRAEIDGGARVAGRPLHSPTSPTAADTDGDGESDYDEILDGTVDPRVAEVPEFDVALSQESPGVFIKLKTEEEEEVELESSTETEDVRATEDERTQRTVHEFSREINAELHGGVGTTDEGAPAPKIGGSFGFKLAWNTTKEKVHTTKFTAESRRRAEERYAESFSRKTDPEGALSATFTVTNESQVSALNLRNLKVRAAFICLPRPDAARGCASPDRMTSVPEELVPDPQAYPNGVTLLAGESKEVNMTADGVDANLLKSILANPSNLSFRPAQADVFVPGDEQPLAATIGKSVPRSTSRLTIDDGAGTVVSYTVATAQNRAWGAPDAAMAPPTPISEILDIVGEPYTTLQNPPVAPATHGPRVLETLRGRTAQPLGADGSVPGTWLLLGTAASGLDVEDFDDISLTIGDALTIAWIADEDGDGLFDREERQLGTSDLDTDSDGDNATCAAAPGGCGADPGPARFSDYFESQVGWLVPQIGGAPAYRVYGNPASCDGDRDRSPDGPWLTDRQAQTDCAALPATPKYASELERSTDPDLQDTNGNGVFDGDDAAPTAAPPTPTSDREFRLDELVGTGDAVLDGDRWRLLSTGAAAALETPAFALCGDRSAECPDATGYYRVTWDMASGGDFASPILGAFSVTAEAAAGAPRETLLRASLDQGENPTASVRPRELYFAAPTGLAKVTLRFTAFRGADVVQGVRIEPVGIPGDDLANRALFLNAAYANGDPAAGPNTAFAALALRARDLAPGAPAAGAQGVTLTGAPAPPPTQENPPPAPFQVQAYGPGASMPAFFTTVDVRFGFRVDATPGAGELLATAGVSTGVEPPGPGSDVLVPSQSSLGLPTLQECDLYGSGCSFDGSATRVPLAQAHLWRSDFAASGATTYGHVLYETAADVPNLSFPVAVAPGATGLGFDNVVIDPLGTAAPEVATNADGRSWMRTYLGEMDNEGRVRFPRPTDLSGRAFAWSGAGMLPTTGYFTNGFGASAGPDGSVDLSRVRLNSLLPDAGRLLQDPDGGDQLKRTNIQVDPRYHQWAEVIEPLGSATCNPDDTLIKTDVRDEARDKHEPTDTKQREVASDADVILPNSGVDRDDRRRRAFPQTRINITLQGCNDQNGPDVRIRRLLLLSRPFATLPPG